MKTLYLAAAFLVSGAVVHACDNVSALTGSCYSQSLRQRIVVERVVQPEYVVVPQRVVVQEYAAPIVREKVVQRQVIKRPARLQLRSKVVRRERIVERY